MFPFRYTNNCRETHVIRGNSVNQHCRKQQRNVRSQFAATVYKMVWPQATTLLTLYFLHLMRLISRQKSRFLLAANAAANRSLTILGLSSFLRAFWMAAWYWVLVLRMTASTIPLRGLPKSTHILCQDKELFLRRSTNYVHEGYNHECHDI